MADITSPIALDESFNTTETTPRNIADVVADETGDLVTQATAIVTKLQALINAVKPNASDIPLDPITGMSATNVQSGISELKGTLDVLENNTHKFAITTSDTTIVLPSVYRGVLITCDSDSTRCGMWMIFSYSDGSGSKVSMFSSATGITITNTSNGIKVKTNSGGSSGIIIDISKHVTSIS